MTVPSNTFRPTASTPLVPVFFTLRIDRVSQEINETFNITLTLNPVTTVPNSYYPTITVTIIDSDGELNSQCCSYKYFIIIIIVATFELAEDDYLQIEGGDLEIIVLKNKDVTLSNPVTVRITPLTVPEALDRGIITTFDDDDRLSPNRAGKCINSLTAYFINTCTVNLT